MNKTRPWQFDVIYADPPWPSKTRPTPPISRAANKRGTVSLEQIKGMSLRVVAKPDSVLFVWASDLMLAEALEVIEAWGFKYRAVAFYWIKERAKKGGDFTVPGYGAPAAPEICLLATRGRGVKFSKPGIGRLISAPRTRDMQKPPEVRRRIERLFGPVRRLQVFGVQKPDGWSAYRMAAPGDSPSDHGSRIMETTLGDFSSTSDGE